MLLELALQPFEKSEGIRGRARETNNDAVADSPHLLGVWLGVTAPRAQAAAAAGGVNKARCQGRGARPRPRPNVIAPSSRGSRETLGRPRSLPAAHPDLRHQARRPANRASQTHHFPSLAHAQDGRAVLMGNWGQAESVGVRWPPRAARTMFTAPALGAIHDESARRAANRVGSVAIRLNVNIVSSQCAPLEAVLNQKLFDCQEPLEQELETRGRRPPERCSWTVLTLSYDGREFRRRGDETRRRRR
jgi:hypothetical protein